MFYLLSMYIYVQISSFLPVRLKSSRSFRSPIFSKTLPGFCPYDNVNPSTSSLFPTIMTPTACTRLQLRLRRLQSRHQQVPNIARGFVKIEAHSLRAQTL
jgi:hypothetical protein